MTRGPGLTYCSSETQPKSSAILELSDHRQGARLPGVWFDVMQMEIKECVCVCRGGANGVSNENEARRLRPKWVDRHMAGVSCSLCPLGIIWALSYSV